MIDFGKKLDWKKFGNWIDHNYACNNLTDLKNKVLFTFTRNENNSENFVSKCIFVK